MKVPEEFDPIRPYEPEELPQVYDKLLSDEQFKSVLAKVYPNVPIEVIGKKMHQCKTNLDFQKGFVYDIIMRIVHELTTGIDINALNVDIKNRYTFVSNHRDIVLDSGFLDKLLLDVGFDTTCEIAIGDNLLSIDWVRDMARINKTFTVERALKSSEMLKASKRMSEYMHFVIAKKHSNIWIAQRQGRAKNSNDVTQPAILKMMAMGGEGTIIDRLMQLHIVPLSISYQYDPCDYLKAREYQLRRDVPFWKKSAGDDMESMATGLKGYKGHVHYYCAPCIDDWLQTVDQDQPRNKMFDEIAAHIDQEIHRGYYLYPQNYVALDMIQNTTMYDDHYTKEEFDQFAEYVASRLALIDIDHKDESFLRRCILTQYAYPTRNYITASESTGRWKQFFSKFNFMK